MTGEHGAANAGEPTGIGPGAFVAVVGASGVGKDALLSWAAEHADGTVVVPRRSITRPAGSGEDHDPVDPDRFAQLDAAGRFALTWSAHGLRYGIPVSVDDTVRAGGTVVANVSRSALVVLDRRYERVLVVRVQVPDDVRARRLRGRGRERADDLAGRLTRPDPAPDHAVHAVIDNTGTVADGGRQLLDVLRDAAAIPATGPTSRRPRVGAARPPGDEVAPL